MLYSAYFVRRFEDKSFVTFAVKEKRRVSWTRRSCRSLTGWLPDVARVVAYHLLAWFAFKGLSEIGVVLDGANHAVLSRRMRVSLSQQTRAFRRAVLAPDLGKAEEEALFSREAILLLCDFRIFRHLLTQRHQGNVNSAIVRGVFAQCQAAVEVDILYRNELAVFISNAAGALFELLAVLVGPPVGEIAVSSELAALIVKTVSQFVANHHADAAKVHGVVLRHIKERRLENAGR